MKKKFLIPEVKSVSMQPIEILASSGDPGGGEGTNTDGTGGAAKLGTGMKLQWN